jgi:small subunit ribosomal protein S4
MSRYRGPRLRIIRRLGELPGFTRKTTTKTTPPGQHGATSKKPRKLSQYGIRLQEKQKLRYNYGINESQLIRYVQKARKLKGSTGEILLQLLEMRLDNIVFRLGMAPTISAARQIITHGHILVNTERVNIPSYQCKPKDIIAANAKIDSRKLITNFLENGKTNQEALRTPPHLSFNKESLIGVVNAIVSRQWIGLRINELLIVEYYSRKV